jgi:hypothetical protein
VGEIRSSSRRYLYGNDVASRKVYTAKPKEALA